MQNFSDATYKNILDYMLSLVPDTYDKRDTSPIQTSLGPAAYVLEGFYLSLDLVQKQAFVQTAAGDSLDLLAERRHLRQCRRRRCQTYRRCGRRQRSCNAYLHRQRIQ